MQETQEIWVLSLGWEVPLEEEMATHSSILALEISWTERSLTGYSPQGHQVSETAERLSIHTHTVRAEIPVCSITAQYTN